MQPRKLENVVHEDDEEQLKTNKVSKKINRTIIRTVLWCSVQKKAVDEVNLQSHAKPKINRKSCLSH